MPPTEEHPKSSVLRTILVTFALVLLGILLGVLASRFVPTAPTAIAPAEPTVEPTQELAPIETPVPEPTATSSALLSLKWNMMTVKSPLTRFNSYRIYYPTTWSIKEYKNVPKDGELGSSTLTLTKGKTVLNILQVNQLDPMCDFSGKLEYAGEGIVQLGEFKIIEKSGFRTWQWAPLLNVTATEYLVCQSRDTGTFNSSTSIGFINFRGENIDVETLDEINYILEKIVILP